MNFNVIHLPKNEKIRLVGSLLLLKWCFYVPGGSRKLAHLAVAKLKNHENHPPAQAGKVNPGSGEVKELRKPSVGASSQSSSGSGEA